MADLSAADRDRRAQLLLAGAFVLAVALIGLTLVLTSSSYTTTLASQEDDIVRGNDAVAIRESLDTALTRQFRFVFENYSAGNREAPFEAVVTQVGNETTSHYARRGRMVNATMEASGAEFIEGTRIKQEQTGFTFEQPAGGATGGADYWYPAKRVEVRNLTLVVTDIAAATVQPENAFNMSFETPAAAGGNWSVTIYQDFSLSDPLVIRTRSPEGVIRKCQTGSVAATNSATIHVHNGTVDGDDCDALDPIDPGRHEYTVNFTRSHKIFGKYWMIVDEPPSSGSPSLSDKFDAGSRSSAEPVLFGARVRYRYHSATVSYETNIDIAHRELS
ncbi:DUF7261 family protein [Halosimplex halophilum]|uniref:DUF7261 family protein n=1 Tax=Halosimplex halophilum TaxID=2559572 RepID=UPI00107F7473|nr:hypothetical protein [Halosimplex halophilum]